MTRRSVVPGNVWSVAGYAGPQQLRRLLDAVMAVASDLGLATVLERIVNAAAELAGARYGALRVLDPTRTHLVEFITVGLDDTQRAAIGEMPKGHGLLGVLITDPRPIRVPDLNEHTERFGFPANHPPMTSFLGVPLYVRGEVFGNLYLTDKADGSAFTDIDEELVSSLAAAASIAIENARLHDRTNELSLLAERERIGRELHDTVVQRLFATGLGMQGTARLTDRPEVRDRLQKHIAELDETIRQIRSAIFELDAPRLIGRSLRRDILDLTAESARMLGFDPVVHLDGPIDTLVPESMIATILAVVREALSNVARHANAEHVDVVVRAGSALLIEISDDGSGYAPHAGSGNGLRNMASRAAEHGGDFEITPGGGGGAVVRWSVPLP